MKKLLVVLALGPALCLASGCTYHETEVKERPTTTHVIERDVDRVERVDINVEHDYDD